MTARAAAGEGARGALSRARQAVRRLLEVDIWAANLGEVAPRRAALFRSLRVLQTTVQRWNEQRLTFRAAALTYYTLLSIVPFLAFAFALLKGFGAYRMLVEQVLRPSLRVTLGASPSLLAAAEKILEFVEQTDVSKLGALGLLFLAWTSISLLSSVEVALNEIWAAKSQRPLLRQVTDYTTLLVTTPLLVLAAITIATAAQSSGVVERLLGLPHVDWMVQLGLRLLPAAIAALALVAVYSILPNVKTKLGSVLLGGIVAGIAWQVALVLHVRFQIGVANYNALYSGFGALPIFLFWVYVSWVIVLAGALLAASHQNEPLVRQRVRARHAGQALKERLAIAVAGHVARAFVRGAGRPTVASLASALEMPPIAIEEVLDAMACEGIVARTVMGSEVGFLPSRDPSTLRVHDVREALRTRRATEATPLELPLDPELEALLAAQEQEARRSRHNLTLRELAELMDADEAPLAAVGELAPPVVADAKQPELPG